VAAAVAAAAAAAPLAASCWAVAENQRWRTADAAQHACSVRPEVLAPLKDCASAPSCLQSWAKCLRILPACCQPNRDYTNHGTSSSEMAN
jgi:hypothetical protein